MYGSSYARNGCGCGCMRDGKENNVLFDLKGDTVEFEPWSIPNLVKLRSKIPHMILRLPISINWIFDLAFNVTTKFVPFTVCTYQG